MKQAHLSRDAILQKLRAKGPHFDFLIIGGGATGLGVAVESSSRGYRTLLVEQSDFAQGTSSRSTKLVHGGVRYLRQGNVGLVLEALKERGLLIQNAPHLVRNLPFVVPNYDWWEGPFYGVGLKLYDVLAGKLGLGPSKVLTRDETLALLPTVEPEGLKGGVIYHDGQFDDARLAVNLAQTVHDLGGVALNYVRVTALTKRDGIVAGVSAVDTETGEQFEFTASVVVNATGVFTDSILSMDDPQAPSIISPSQGVHIVLDRSFLPSESAVMVPRTDDGRVLFAVPWHGRVVVGTTDTPVDHVSIEPRPLPEEIEFLLTHAARYLTKDPVEADVLSMFAGLRPLVRTGADADTASLSRDHSLIISPSGLVTITGGKWTTYRKMAEDTVDEGALVGGLDDRPCVTRELRIHGWTAHPGEPEKRLAYYGADADLVLEMEAGDPSSTTLIHDRLPYSESLVRWGVRAEMARTVEDILSRRTRSLLIDARASVEAAPRVAQIVAEELGRSTAWIEDQVQSYRRLAQNYVLGPL